MNWSNGWDSFGGGGVHSKLLGVTVTLLLTLLDHEETGSAPVPLVSQDHTDQSSRRPLCSMVLGKVLSSCFCCLAWKAVIKPPTPHSSRAPEANGFEPSFKESQTQGSQTEIPATMGAETQGTQGSSGLTGPRVQGGREEEILYITTVQHIPSPYSVPPSPHDLTF